MLLAKRIVSAPLAVPLAAAIGLLALWSFSPTATQRTLANSALLAAGATAIALPIGTLLAVLIGRFDLPGRRIAAACLGVLLFLPLYVQLCGWDAVAGRLGWLTLVFGSLEHPLLVGMRAAIVIHALAAIPWVALVVGQGLSQVDPAQEEAALLVLPPGGVLWRVTLPAALPFIIAAAIFTIVGTTSEMTVTNIYLINTSEQTYTEKFYMVLSLQADPSEAALAVLPGLASLAILVAVALWLVATMFAWPRPVVTRPMVTFAAGALRLPLTALVWLVVGTLLFVPIASLISKAGFVVVHEAGQRTQSWSLVQCLTEVATAPRRFSFEFGWTLATAAAAATLALLVAILLAWPARRGGWRAAPAIVAAVLGLVVPGPLVGVALIWIFNRSLWPGVFDPLVFLYDQRPIMPAVAQAIHALPLTILVSWYSFRTLSDEVLSAAALDGVGPWQALVRIALPQRWPALAGAWLAAFAIASGDLAWSQLLRPPKMDLIQRRVFGLVHSGVEEQVAAISLINVLAYAAVALLILGLMSRTRLVRAT
jgi:iron(III) transport system permease protein